MPSNTEIWPRVWWVRSSLLTILPIRASGHHDSIPLKTALDYIISSYAPTVKSLLYARERAARFDLVKLTDKAIVVAMPVTPEKESLPGVENEVKELEHLFSKASINTTIIRNPTTTVVLSELPKHSIVHFGCHGNSGDDPSQSCLFLADAPFTVSDIISLNIQSAKMAYLSASSMRSFSLLDESISLSSAIQLSGYSSVIGSLWNVADDHAAKIAKDVYTWILEGEGRLDVRKSAESLHKAVRNLRERTRCKKRHNPLIWAPFVHIGI